MISLLPDCGYNGSMQLALLFLVPFAGTVLGSLAVYLFPSGIGRTAEKTIMGFAAGVMVAASFWSLLLPAIESSSYYMAALGLGAGMLLLYLIDQFTPHLHATAEKAEGRKSGLSKSALLMLAVTIHNIPEGMAVGAGAATLTAGGGSYSYSSALALSLGIALQNFPEGMVVSFPLYKEGRKKSYAFLQGALSGAVEPIGALIAYAFVSSVSSLLPLFLSSAAGAMLYVVVEELIPEASEGEHSNAGTMGFAAGFIAMMLLDGIFG